MWHAIAKIGIFLYGLHPAFWGTTRRVMVPLPLYADVSALTDDSLSFAKALIEEKGVAITSGVDFDPEKATILSAYHLRAKPPI